MLGLVDQNSHRPPKCECSLDGVMVFGAHGSRTRHESNDSVPDSDGRLWVDLVVDEGFFHLKQQPSKMITPTEASGFRRDAFHADYRQTPAIDFEHRNQFSSEKLLDLRAQCCFANARWPDDQNQGIRWHLVNRI